MTQPYTQAQVDAEVDALRNSGTLAILSVDVNSRDTFQLFTSVLTAKYIKFYIFDNLIYMSEQDARWLDKSDFIPADITVSYQNENTISDDNIMADGTIIYPDMIGVMSTAIVLASNAHYKQLALDSGYKEHPFIANYMIKERIEYDSKDDMIADVKDWIICGQTAYIIY